MKPISYKGYQASVEYEDGSLFIKVLHIDDLLVAQCEAASEVESCAHALIDDYLATCAELGRDPSPTYKGSFNVRMEPELHRKVATASADLGISLNAWINLAVKEKLSCNDIEARFDGVFTKKRQEMSVEATLQVLRAQQSINASLFYEGHYQTAQDTPQFAYVDYIADNPIEGRHVFMPSGRVKMHG